MPSAKFFRIIILCLGSALCFPLKAQTDLLDTPISIELKQVKLQKALKKLSVRYHIKFSYSSKKIPVDEIISLSVQKKPLRLVLNELLEDLKIKYVLVEGQIILTKRRPETNEAVADNRKYTVSGYLRDEKTGESLLGATVYIKEIESGVITNSYGFYSVTLPAGSYTFYVSYIGYEGKEMVIDLKSDRSLVIRLAPSISLLEELVIVPDDSVQLVENVRLSATKLNPLEMQNRPAVMGEGDLIKSLDLQPGVQLFRDGSTFFHVRGGDRDQNQILMDEAPIYNPAHLLGIFSTIMPGTIKSLKLFKGDSPARLGGRVSSILEVNTRDGNMNRFGMEGNVGLMAGRISLEGPLKKERSSYFLSLRASHLGPYLRALNPEINILKFTDLNLKLNFKTNHNNHFYLSTYFGNDEFELQRESGINWQNNAVTFRWNHLFSDRLFSNTTLYSSVYHYALLVSKSKKEQWVSKIANVSLKTDFTQYLNPSNTLQFGFRLSAHQFNPGNFEDLNGNQKPTVPIVYHRNANEFSLYANNEQNLNNRLLVNYGIRLSTWTNVGPTTEILLSDQRQPIDTVKYGDREEYHTHASLEPRFGLTYLISGQKSVKLNFSGNAQYINLIGNSISPFNNLEVWLPAGPNILPQRSTQLSITYHSSLGQKLRWTTQVYSKFLSNQLDYRDHPNLLLNPALEGELRTGKGLAYGIELGLKKESGKLRGQLSYTFSRSWREIAGINGGRAYPTLWDRPHQFVLGGTFQRGGRAIWSSSLYISSGPPISIPTSFYSYNGRQVPIYNRKNNDRLLPYNRLDIAFTYRLNKRERGFNNSLTFSIFNLYGQENVVFRNFNKILDENGNWRVPLNVAGNPPITPSKFFIYKFIPSITYKFKV